MTFAFGRIQTLNLEDLSHELGPDYRIADYIARSRCSKIRLQVAAALGADQADTAGCVEVSLLWRVRVVVTQQKDRST